MFHAITLSCSLLVSIIFTQMNHPLAMGFMLLIQTLCICLITGFMTQSFWFSYILFLVFLGGLLVLFIYVTSLASNEMFTLSSSTIIMSTIMLIVCFSFILILDPLTYLTNSFNTEMMDINTINFFHEEVTLSLTWLYNPPTGFVTIMLVLYLFLTLIAVVTITDINLGPLRQKN